MSRRDIDYLHYIESSIDHVQRWSNIGFDALLADEIRYEAVLRRLETLSDAVSYLSQDLRDRHPEIPWRAIGDFRNRLAHGYLDINPERIRDVLEIDLPRLLNAVREEIDRTEHGGAPNL